MKSLLVLLVVVAYRVSFSASEIKAGPGQITISGNFSSVEDKEKTYFNLAAGMKGEQGMKGEKGEPGPPCVLDPETRANLTAEIKKCAFPSSCKELYECDPTLPSGYHEIWTRKGVKKVYCKMNSDCNGTGGWMRVAYIDANNDTRSCNKRELNHTTIILECPRIPFGCTPLPLYMCTRSHPDKHGCSSVTFSTHGVPYTKVCGRAHGYQLGNVSAFYSYKHREQDLESAYVSGLSVTRGKEGERKHIWTFAAGYSKNASGNASLNCPCATNKGPTEPPFVDKNYFCETGNLNERQEREELPDILWDSKKCASNSTCCEHDDPWFTTTVNRKLKNEEKKSARDDIEVRLCQPSESETENMREDIGLKELEIYIY